MRSATWRSSCSPPGRLDLAVSALALHHIVDLRRLVPVVYDTLEPGGNFGFTTVHPIFTAPTSPGWRQVAGNRVRPLDRYRRASGAPSS